MQVPHGSASGKGLSVVFGPDFPYLGTQKQMHESKISKKFLLLQAEVIGQRCNEKKFLGSYLSYWQIPPIKFPSFFTRGLMQLGLGDQVLEILWSRVGDYQLFDAQSGRKKFSAVHVIDGSHLTFRDVAAVVFQVLLDFLRVQSNLGRLFHTIYPNPWDRTDFESFCQRYL